MLTQITGPGSTWVCIRLEDGSQCDIEGLQATGINGYCVLSPTGGSVMRCSHTVVKGNKISAAVCSETGSKAFFTHCQLEQDHEEESEAAVLATAPGCLIEATNCSIVSKTGSVAVAKNSGSVVLTGCKELVSAGTAPAACIVRGKGSTLAVQDCDVALCGRMSIAAKSSSSSPVGSAVGREPVGTVFLVDKGATGVFEDIRWAAVAAPSGAGPESLSSPPTEATTTNSIISLASSSSSGTVSDSTAHHQAACWVVAREDGSVATVGRVQGWGPGSASEVQGGKVEVII